MIRFERQQQILEYLSVHKCAKIAQLAGLLYASEASVRRDIAVLEEQGLVRRKYGGVILAEYEHSVVPLALRDSKNGGVKDIIASRAAQMVEDGMTVLLDASSTARRVAEHLEGKRDIRIITNNARLPERAPANITVYSTGGRYERQNRAFVGAKAEEFVRSMHADILFFSSQGMSETGVISDASEEETALRRVMLSAADRRYFLCDSSKLGIRHTFVLCSKEDIDGIICDISLPWEDK